MKSRSGLRLAAAGVVVFAAACAQRNYPGTKQPPADDNLCNQAGAFCVDNTGCCGDLICRGGVCSSVDPNSACTSHQQCPVGMFCNIATGRCVDCLNDDHCDPNQSCLADGTCGTSGPTGCQSNTDCGQLRCNTTTHQCVQCVSNTDCPTGQTCRNNQCTTTGSGPPQCTSQQQCDAYAQVCDTVAHQCINCDGAHPCPAPRVCGSAGRCVDCANDGDCDPGYSCSGGTCVPAQNGGSGSCFDKTDCGGYACFFGFCVPCFFDFMCFDLADIFGGSSAICDVSTGTCINPDCSTANDCPAGQGCYSGHCGACAASGECRSGEVCDTSSGTCRPPGWCTGNADCIGGQVCTGNQCGPCTGPGQCDNPQTCTNGRCAGTGQLGAPCTDHNDCAAGFICLTGNAGGECTRTCIGSGKGGDADCPSGYACENYESGPLDGLVMCNAATQLDASFPGQPFDRSPGAGCDPSMSPSDGCQTSVCYTTATTCARACSANRDCVSGEVCYAATDSNGAMLGWHLCYYSDTTNYLPAGADCSENYDCDSGLCAGGCSEDSSYACNGSSDCFFGCAGVCRDHCRSNADCPSGQSCNPWPTQATNMTGWVPTCLPKYFSGTQADGSACSTDSVCSSDWCVGGICSTPCAINADCTGTLAGRFCEPLTFVDSGGNPVYSMAFCL